MRALVAELVGTALLLAAVVGSGIMGERLAGGNVAVALLANTLATGAALVALILTFGAISGAHFNPVVSFADASQGGLTWTRATAYSVAQQLVTTAWTLLMALVLMIWVFGWGGGKALVQHSYVEAKVKAEEQKARRAAGSGVEEPPDRSPTVLS